MAWRHLNWRRWSAARRWQVTGLGLAVLAAAGWYLAGSGGAPKADGLAEPPLLSVRPASSPPASAVASAAAVPVLAERTGPGLKEKGLLASPALDWYQAALLPTASIRDRVTAIHISLLCSNVRSSAAAYPELRAARLRPPVASVPGVSAAELADLNRRNAMEAPVEQEAALQTFVDYCRPVEGFGLISQLRKASTRPSDYFDLALPTRPIDSRLPVVTNVLTNPQANALEFTIWADHGLRDVFERGHGLDELEAWHASRWLVREVLGNRPEVALFERTQCAVYGFCGSATLLTDAERQRADAAARQVLTDLQRQDWPRLILKSPRVER